ncbi:MAG: polysaccharide deacetylase [Lachnospiraceae bacterium]|nr:polysaccharide deacetylase [Lachnospiraceae bacterium]
MATENSAPSEVRRKRVQRLKRGIIISLVASILIPIILCIFLLIRLFSMESRLKELEELLSNMQMQVSSGSVNMEESENSGLIQGPVVADLLGEISIGMDSEGEEVLQDGQEELPEEPVRKVYLTFDDGPSSGTGEILDILAEYDVKATFFVVGKEAEWAQDAYRRIVEEGHTLGMHSYTHDYQQIYASLDAYSEDLLKLQDYLYDVTGVRSVYVRFPGGSSNTVSRTDMRELIAYLEEEGFTYYDWNISSQDASGVRLTPEQIVNNCLQGLEKKDNVIILMHDAASKHTTVEALPILIESIQAMENTELLPITEDTVPVQHITISHEETEE